MRERPLMAALGPLRLRGGRKMLGRCGGKGPSLNQSRHDPVSAQREHAKDLGSLQSGSSQSRVGSEAACLEQAAGDVVGEVAQAEGGAA